MRLKDVEHALHLLGPQPWTLSNHYRTLAREICYNAQPDPDFQPSDDDDESDSDDKDHVSTGIKIWEEWFSSAEEYFSTMTFKDYMWSNRNTVKTFTYWKTVLSGDSSCLRCEGFNHLVDEIEHTVQESQHPGIVRRTLQ